MLNKLKLKSTIVFLNKNNCDLFILSLVFFETVLLTHFAYILMYFLCKNGELSNLCF